MKICNKSLYIFIGSLVLSGICNNLVCGMIPTVKEKKVTFNSTQIDSDWKINNNLSSEEERQYYNDLWDVNQTLSENIQNIVDIFFETCCDFSFKTETISKDLSDSIYKKQENISKHQTQDSFCSEILKGVYLGKCESGNIIFLDTGNYIFENKDEENIVLHNEENMIVELPVAFDDDVLIDFRPLDLDLTMIKTLKNYIVELAQDSVGCELLRVYISKNKASNGRKIVFIPVSNEDLDCGLAYISEGVISQYLLDDNNYALQKDEPKAKHIVFNFDILLNNKPEPVIKKSKTSKAEFTVQFLKVPLEANLFYGIVCSLIKDKGNTWMIELRSRKIAKQHSIPCFWYEFDEIGDTLVSIATVNQSMFFNDKDYQAIFGIEMSGVNILNESAFLSHKYNYMRSSHIGARTMFSVNDKKASKEGMYTFIKKFIEAGFGDNELYRYYLSNESEINYPAFGKGNYICKENK